MQKQNQSNPWQLPKGNQQVALTSAACKKALEVGASMAEYKSLPGYLYHGISYGNPGKEAWEFLDEERKGQSADL